MTYLVTQPHLEGRPVFLGPSCGMLCVLTAQLQQIPKKWYTRNFGQSLDFGNVGTVGIFDEGKDDCHNGKPNHLERHLATDSTEKCVDVCSTRLDGYNLRLEGKTTFLTE